MFGAGFFVIFRYNKKLEIMRKRKYNFKLGQGFIIVTLKKDRDASSPTSHSMRLDYLGAANREEYQMLTNTKADLLLQIAMKSVHELN